MTPLKGGKPRDDRFGYIPWHELEPGDELLVPRGYSSLITILNRRYPNARFSGTIRGAPEDFYILRRIK